MTLKKKDLSTGEFCKIFGMISVGVIIGVACGKSPLGMFVGAAGVVFLLFISLSMISYVVSPIKKTQQKGGSHLFFPIVILTQIFKYRLKSEEKNSMNEATEPVEEAQRPSTPLETVSSSRDPTVSHIRRIGDLFKDRTERVAFSIKDMTTQHWTTTKQFVSQAIFPRRNNMQVALPEENPQKVFGERSSSKGFLRRGIEKILYFGITAIRKDNILLVAEKGLPIGRLLPYGENWEDLLWDTLLLEAVHKGNVKKVKALMKVLTQEALYQYLCHKDFVEWGPLQWAAFYVKGDPKEENQKAILTALIKAIAPQVRVPLLCQLEYGFYLAFIDKMAIVQVMNCLSEEERYVFLSQVHPLWGDIPLMAFDCKEELEALLESCPNAPLWQYLTHKNCFGRTVFLEWLPCSDGLGSDAARMVDYLLSLVPEGQREALLAYHDQGKKAMWFAQANGLCNVVRLLEKYGIPRRVPKLSQIEKEAVVNRWRAIPLEEQQALFRRLQKEEDLRDLCRGRHRLKLDNMEEMDIMETWWEVMDAQRKDILFTALEEYNIPIPPHYIRHKEFIDTLSRWAVTEALGRLGVSVTEEEGLETLWGRLDAMKTNPTRKEERDKEQQEISKSIEAFWLCYGKHPAEILGVAKDKWYDEKERKKAFHRTMLEIHPDKNKEDVQAKEKAALVIAAYELYTKPEKRQRYLKGADLAYAKAGDEIRTQLEIDWKQTFARRRFRERIFAGSRSVVIVKS